MLLFFFQVMGFSDEIKSDKVFDSLLHLFRDTPDINDPKFYLSYKFKSSNEEIKKSKIEFFENKNISAICRFPARYEYLRQRFNVSENLLSQCDDLSEFIQKVPFDKVSVVFASENISMPTSMMGHIFLKLSGANDQKQFLEHAISFFTDVNEINFVKLIIQSLITGMDGVYALTPYQEIKVNYLYNEQRNLYEYELKLNEKEKRLLQLHLFELKNTKFEYFFHKFNCATVINNILSVSFPKLKDDRSLWMTPLDIVRSIYHGNFIEKTTVILSSEWKLKSIQDSNKIPKLVNQSLKNQDYDKITNLNLENKDKFLYLTMAKSYNDYLFENSFISKDDWNSKDDQIERDRKKVLPDGEIDLANYKSPAKTIQDSQTSISYSNNRMLGINLLFASHYLSDDTRNYSNESELKLGDIKLNYSSSNKKISLAHFNLYSATIIRPNDPLVGGKSFKFDFSYLNENVYDSSWRILFGVGKDFKLHNDLELYTLLDSEMLLDRKLHLLIGPEVGFIMRQIFNLKFVGNISRKYDLVNSKKYADELNLTEQMNFKDFAIGANYLYQLNMLKKYNLVSFYFKHFF